MRTCLPSTGSRADSGEGQSVLVVAQAGARGMAARALARRLRGEAAAVRVQAAWRRHAARARFLRVRSAVLAIQAAYRGLTARAVAADLRCAGSPSACNPVSCSAHTAAFAARVMAADVQCIEVLCAWPQARAELSICLRRLGAAAWGSSMQ